MTLRAGASWRRRAARLLALAALVVPAACGTAAPAAAPPGASGRCGAPQYPPAQAGLHLIGETAPPVPYSSIPPTSGWHSSGAVAIGVAPPGRALSEPQQVGVLEAGGVVVTHGELAPADRQQLEQLAQERAGRLAVTAYPRLAPGQVVLAAWGVLQRCDGVDLGATGAFVDFYARPHAGH